MSILNQSLNPLVGTLNQVSVNGNVLSLPQSIAPTSSPTFVGVKLGTTNTTSTITAATPASNRTYTLPDAGTNTTILLANGPQSINGATTFNSTIATTIPSGLNVTSGSSSVLQAAFPNFIDIPLVGTIPGKWNGNLTATTATTQNILYTVPTGCQAALSGIIVGQTGTVTASYFPQLYASPDGGTTLYQVAAAHLATAQKILVPPSSGYIFQAGDSIIATPGVAISSGTTTYAIVEWVTWTTTASTLKLAEVRGWNGLGSGTPQTLYTCPANTRTLLLSGFPTWGYGSGTLYTADNTGGVNIVVTLNTSGGNSSIVGTPASTGGVGVSPGTLLPFHLDAGDTLTFTSSATGTNGHIWVPIYELPRSIFSLDHPVTTKTREDIKLPLITDNIWTTGEMKRLPPPTIIAKKKAPIIESDDEDDFIEVESPRVKVIVKKGKSKSKGR